jgi:hypothetical protein
MKLIPNLAIFRVPTLEGDIATFAQLDIAPDGFVDEEGQLFSVRETDTYNQLDFDRVVLALQIDGGSRCLGSFQIGKHGGGDEPTPCVVHEMGAALVTEIIPQLVQMYMESDDEADNRQDGASVEG